MMPVYYLGWIMRLYVDFGQLNQFRYREIKDELCEIACIYPNFDICDVSNLPGTPAEDASKIFAKNWRFFPTLDPQVIFEFLNNLFVYQQKLDLPYP